MSDYDDSDLVSALIAARDAGDDVAFDAARQAIVAMHLPFLRSQAARHSRNRRLTGQDLIDHRDELLHEMVVVALEAISTYDPTILGRDTGRPAGTLTHIRRRLMDRVTKLGADGSELTGWAMRVKASCRRQANTYLSENGTEPDTATLALMVRRDLRKPVSPEMVRTVVGWNILSVDQIMDETNDKGNPGSPWRGLPKDGRTPEDDVIDAEEAEARAAKATNDLGRLMVLAELNARQREVIFQRMLPDEPDREDAEGLAMRLYYVAPLFEDDATLATARADALVALEADEKRIIIELRRAGASDGRFTRRAPRKTSRTVTQGQKPRSGPVST